VLFWAGIALALFVTSVTIDYPGSEHVSKSSTMRLRPQFSIRHDAVYRSTDAFSVIYTWYSRGFELGPEEYGLGRCITMARSRKLAPRIDHDMSVQVCDSPKDRVVVVMRRITLRYPDVLRSVIMRL
jgi:hypothetical protein